MGCQTRYGGTLQAPPRNIAVLGPNKAYLCYYKVLRGLLVTVKKKIFDNFFKKWTELLTFLYREKIFKKKKTFFPFKLKSAIFFL